MLISAIPAIAAQRTFVASTGTDANPSSLVSPCRGFAAAVNAGDANGEEVVLDSAGFLLDRPLAFAAHRERLRDGRPHGFKAAINPDI